MADDNEIAPQLVVRPEDVGLELDEYVPPSDDRGRYAAVVRRSNSEHEPLLSDSEDEDIGENAQGNVQGDIFQANR